MYCNRVVDWFVHVVIEPLLLYWKNIETKAGKKGRYYK